MGTTDSSKTRVTPVFDRLFANDPTGATWVDRLLALGSRAELVPALPTHQTLVAGHKRFWGDNERGMFAPLALLEYLVRNIEPALVETSGDSGTTLAKRKALAARDPRTIADALGQLRSKRRGRRWFVLEGESRPDAFLETEELVVCIEGKRTEAGCTTSTTWMRSRSQLVRHMDAAMEQFPNKRVLGLLIVEGDGDATAVTPSTHWQNESAAQYARDMLDRSLPHRQVEERSAIEAGVLGVTTWQAVCSEFNLGWPPAEDQG